MKPATWILASTILALLALTFGLSPEIAEAGKDEWYRPPQSPPMGRGLALAAAQDPGREVKVWVFFTDKGLSSREQVRHALGQVENGWSEDVRLRRRAARSPVQFTDIPVYGRYVNAVAEAGFQVHRRSRWLNAVSVTTPAGRLQELAALPFVRFVQPVLVSRTPPEPVELHGPVALAAGGVDSTLEAGFYGTSYNQLEQIQVLDLHRLGYTGAGVKVMVLDTGFKSSHPAFSTCTDLAWQYDYVFDDGNTENEAEDHPSQHNHGTGVWATLGGYAPGNLVGPAWASTFYVGKTEDIVNEVHAEEDNYVAALEWADSAGVDVVSASLAYLTFDDLSGYSYSDLDGDTAVITVAVDLAVGKGICCVNAMGNAGPGAGSLWTPADADSIIACGAVDIAGTVAGFSSRGPTADGRTKPEISAMGVGTTWAVAGTDGYGFASGTSLSTPLIGGLAALIKEARPGWSGADIRAALMATGTQSGAPDNDMGWGVAQGLDAANFGGGSLSPPRMTLPFALCEPADGADVFTATPELVWGTSVAQQPGDQAQYTVHYQVGAAGTPATAAAGSDTSWTVPPSVLAPGDTLVWWVSAVGDSGYVRKSMDERFLVVDSQLAVGDGPGVALKAPFPNPFRRSASFSWKLEPGQVLRAAVFDAQGRILWETRETGSGGWSTVQWNGRDAAGRTAPAGVYWLRVSTPRGTRGQKLVKLP